MNIQEQIYKKINDYDTIIIHRHQRPDPDAIGSQIGLSSILKKNFPNKQIYVVGKKIDGLSWIGDPDKVDENKFQNALIFVLDTANKPRIDDNRWQKGSYIIKIDHHPEDDVFGDLSLVNVKASSTSEILVDFCRKFHLKFTYQAVKSFYAGIVGDTGRFLYSNTTSHTMEDVSFLMSTKEDLDFTKINRCECEINLSLARLVSYVYENLVITKYGLGYIILKKDILNKFDLENCGTSSIVPLPGNLKEIKEGYKANRLELSTDKNIDEYINVFGMEIEFSKNNEYSIKIDSEEKAHQLLEKLVTNHVEVDKFEIKKPTLNDIFIEKVGEFEK